MKPLQIWRDIWRRHWTTFGRKSRNWTCPLRIHAWKIQWDLQWKLSMTSTFN